MPMKKWRCPNCKTEIKAIAISVTHRCPSKKNEHVAFEPDRNE